jgi:hypothetical protein
MALIAFLGFWFLSGVLIFVATAIGCFLCAENEPKGSNPTPSGPVARVLDLRSHKRSRPY